MRWICSRCGNEVSVALTECPYCAEEEANAPTVVSSPPAAAPSPPPPEPPAAPPRQASPPPSAARVRAALHPPPAREEKEAESAFLRGVKFGVGFALAVAVILFFFALLQFLLREAGWQPWFENLVG